MSILKKLCLGALVGAMALAPVSAKVVTGTQEDTNMKLKYPLVYTDNLLSQRAINTDIASYVGQARKMYYNDHIYQVNQSYDVTYEDKNLVSLMLTTSYYHAGAAHGMYHVQGLVYNKMTGQRIPLYNYVKIASAKQLDQGVRSGILGFYNGAHKKDSIHEGWAVNYASDNYILRGHGVVELIYQPYELGPYAMGKTFIQFTPKAIEYFNRMNG